MDEPRKSENQVASDASDELSMAATMKQLNSRLRNYLYEPNNALIAANLERFERTTNLKREQLIYGLLGIFALYCVIGSFAQIICNAIGFGYPAYASVKAIRTANKEDDTKWLIYWTVFAFFSLVDFFAGLIMSYFPAYWLVKISFLLYLYLPQTNGALFLYKNYVDKFISGLDAYMFKNKQN